MKDFYKVYEVKVVYSEGLATLTGPEPPPGIEGVDPHANNAPLGERGALGIGALRDRQRQVSNRVGTVQADDREQDPAAPRLPSGVRLGARARVR